MPQYFYQYNVQVKGRWNGKKLVNIMAEEFVMKSFVYYEEAILKGVITVNNRNSTSDYILKEEDSIQHLVHFHEPDPPEIQIIAIEDDYLVVNKPSGIACHPTAGYNYFSVIKALEKFGNLSCINRLDVVTSGVLILAFKNPKKYHIQMTRRKVHKLYIAKVKGRFPEKITVDKKLSRRKSNIAYVSDDGKESKTNFKLLKFHNGYSIIECQPETGRSHQIRVHLLSIGFPIVNDFVYNENAECYSKEIKDTTESFLSAIEMQNKIIDCHIGKDEIDDKKLFALNNCRKNNTRAFINQNSFICLHAHKYFFNNKEYVADLPFWTIMN